MNITVDARMIRASGIGSYLSQLLPRIVEHHTGTNFTLLGEKEVLAAYPSLSLPNVRIIPFRSPIYSIRQQFEFFQKMPKSTGLFWAPHYDIPVTYSGPMLVTVHDLFHLAMPQFVEGFHRRLYARWMFNRMAKRASRICVVSQFTRSELLRLVKADLGKIDVTPLGVDPSWFRLEAGQSPHPKPYLLFVGNIKPHKNLIRLLESFKLVWDKIPHDLVLAGNMEGMRTADREVGVRAKEFNGRVHLTGPLSEDLLKQYFVHAEVLVFPSLYEGFGLPPLEAMACGCPVLASKAASIPEVCSDAVLYFDPLSTAEIAQKILELCGNKTLRRELVYKGRKRAESFSWDKCAETTWGALERAIG